MPKKSKNCPRFLTNVLQAVAELSDNNGSTVKKILDQVQASIHGSNVKPKPRNVVMQVRKAIKHGIDNGVLKQRGRKVLLTLGRYEVNHLVSPRELRRPAPRNRGGQLPVEVPKRRTCCRSHSYTTDEPSDGISSRCAMHRKKKKAAMRRRKMRTARRGTYRHNRRPTPANLDRIGEEVLNPKEERLSVRSRRSRLSNINVNPDATDAPTITCSADEDCCNMGHVTGNCGNPECLCNLKQEEPDEDCSDSYNKHNFL